MFEQQSEILKPDSPIKSEIDSCKVTIRHGVVSLDRAEPELVLPSI